MGEWTTVFIAINDLGGTAVNVCYCGFKTFKPTISELRCLSGELFEQNPHRLRFSEIIWCQVDLIL